jgi:D-sedoheptulose 7-phosphate isomerase
MIFKNVIDEHLACFSQLGHMTAEIEGIAEELARTLQAGNKILICGNGGSAADAQHFAAELIGRFEKERPAWPAIALTTDTSILTAVGNDYGFDEVFARQVEGLGRPGDALIAISTSGNSPNVIRAVEAAITSQMATIGLLGRDGGQLKKMTWRSINISEAKTARIQEAHIFILHYWALAVESRMISGGISKGVDR